ncbi:MAG TPA: glycosyltransferase family 2 protein [Thermoanaerobaculia bacterium]|nr:glycosyltransferase family 2 protein [Thermoanaerobaculia bacterium]
MLSPKVTVLVPVFDRERFVAEAIESVVGQEFGDLELLLVDDGSTDRTPQILREWAAREERIRIVTNESNEGIPRALNRGLDHARGEYIARLDSDDLMMPGRLAAQVEVLDRQRDVVLVTTAYDIIDEHGAHLGRFDETLPPAVIRNLLGFTNIIGGGGQVMFRNDGTRYSTEFAASEDYELWVRLSQRGRIVALPLIGMKKRQHENDSLKQYGSDKRANWTAVMRRALEPILRRFPADGEIDALITIWRHDGKRGAGPIAERVMREVFDCFRREHPELTKIFRERIAKQWVEAARRARWAGENFEALRLLIRAGAMKYGGAARRRINS